MKKVAYYFRNGFAGSASCGTEEKNFVELRAGNTQYVFYVHHGSKDEAMCSNTELVSKLGNSNLRVYKLNPRRMHKVMWYPGCPATVNCDGLRKYGFYQTIERIKGNNSVNNKAVHTEPLTEEVKKDQSYCTTHSVYFKLSFYYYIMFCGRNSVCSQ